jgi:hypothetical protein
MLGWHPELAWDVGFQLSFAGTAAIILLTPSIERRLTFMPAVLREPFAVTCAAQVGTVPMMATDFHLLSPIAPLTNALVIPILPVLISAGLLLGALSVVPELARLVAIPVAGLLAYLEQVSFIFAHIPAAAIPIAKFPTWMGLAYYSAIAPAIAATQLHDRRRTLAAATAVLAPALIAAAALGMWANAPPQAIVMAVGDGQAVLLRGQHGAILLDGGPSPARLKDELGSQLPPWQTKLDAIAITAPALGHVGGFAGFDRATSQVLIPDVNLSGSAWRNAAIEATARGASVAKLTAGQTISVAGFEVQVLAPEPRAPGDQVGAAYLALRIVAGSGRSFCEPQRPGHRGADARGSTHSRAMHLSPAAIRRPQPALTRARPRRHQPNDTAHRLARRWKTGQRISAQRAPHRPGGHDQPGDVGEPTAPSSEESAQNDSLRRRYRTRASLRPPAGRAKSG